MKKLTLAKMIKIEKKTGMPFFTYIKDIDYNSIEKVVEIYCNFFDCDMKKTEEILEEEGLEKIITDIIEITENTMGNSKLKSDKKKVKKLKK